MINIIIIITRASLLYFYYVQVQRYTCYESTIPRPEAPISGTSCTQVIWKFTRNRTFSYGYWDTKKKLAILYYLGNYLRYSDSECGNRFLMSQNIHFDTSIISLTLFSTKLQSKSAILDYLENGLRYSNYDCGSELPRLNYIGFDSLITYLGLCSPKLWEKAQTSHFEFGGHLWCSFPFLLQKLEVPWVTNFL